MRCSSDSVHASCKEDYSCGNRNGFPGWWLGMALGLLCMEVDVQ
jgi:hypothetical protein